ncbi:O-antigen ligase domain-containing protein [Mangrovimicrobium sediminis]|uniref:O-antigen ligase domain-containing protein n=1 Tax=Mangrovimicrobium sediminis TaxID=2562682 RepID=A0A4Z0LX05_9GAMM|nr:O-antigen ligase family protein [Haliea sp. SAOS-164]TGD71882.1 O-antigen ligase domain-containing protein [Haliea sp. SAOS-164]
MSDASAYAVFLLPLAAVGFVLFLASFRNALWFLTFHLVVRSLIDSASQYTYLPVIGPLSIAATYSVIYICLIFVFLVSKRKRIFSPLLVPLAAYLVVLLLSTIFSGRWTDLIEVSIKWVYFYLVFLLAWSIADSYPMRKIAWALTIGASYPIANQLLMSVVRGPKCIEGQAICSYVGSFYHESELAAWILIFILGTMLGFRSNSKPRVKYFFLAAILVGVLSLLLNGYRTAILAFVVLLIYLYVVYLRKLSVPVAIFVGFAFAWFGVAGFIYAYDSLGAYIGDFVTVFSNPGHYLTISGEPDNKEVFSGRLYLFSLTLYQYVNGGPVEYLLGIGPNGVQAEIGVYAHNEFVSALVESGILGFLVFAWLLLVCWKVVAASNDRLLLGVYLCVLVMAMATMPLHNIRSMVLLAVTFGIAYGQYAKQRVSVPGRRTKKIVGNVGPMRA